MTHYLKTTLETPAAWRGSELVDKTDWIKDFEPKQIDDLSEAGAAASNRASGTGLADQALPVFVGLRDWLLGRLEGGQGFALVRGFPTGCGAPVIEQMFWTFGTQFGTPEPQDAAGNLLHHVRDTGRRLERNDDLRAYQTNRAINYHNDGSDVFALLCLQQAKEGGRSRLVSAVSVFNEIVRRRHDLAQVLQEPFHFDARGQQLPNAPPVQEVPIYSYHEGHLNVLYKREYIDLAQRFENVPRLSPKQIEALHLMDQVCDELALEFDMHPGDILIANNYDMLHARSEFSDSHGEEGRHMLRLWMTIPNGRPLPPIFESTREFHYSYRRRQYGRSSRIDRESK